jgi:hypothetical protein
MLAFEIRLVAKTISTATKKKKKFETQVGRRIHSHRVHVWTLDLDEVDNCPLGS